MAEVSCSACGAALVRDSRFCHVCGRQTAAPEVPRFASPIGYTPPHLVERILQHRSALEGERKHVTVLFCDLVGSTGLAERLGAEPMHELLAAFFEASLEMIHLYEGTVNQFLGDGFMALFGAPLAIEHHERQAVLAAAALRDDLPGRLRRFEAAAERAIRVRIGVNTGAVVVGKIGDNLRMDYTAVGDTTNVAARLQTMAEPGAILVGPTTWERARGLFGGESLGPLTLSGRDAPVHVHRVLRRLPSRSTLDERPDRPPSRFVGRERELAALHAAIDQVEQEQGQVIGVMGDAGLGKSRLLAELRRGLGGRAFTWLEGRCLPYGSGIPYLPILDLLRANCRIVDTDTPEVVAAKVAAALGEVGLDAAVAGPVLLQLLGVKEPGGADEGPGAETLKARTFETLRALAVRGSRQRPLVFVVEDLHWIDSTSLEFLVDVVEAAAGARMLLIATYRPGWAPPWAAKSYATQLALRPLGEADSLAVIASSLGDVVSTAEERRAIVMRGEGNPFFLEELARARVEQGGAAPAGWIPDTLHGLLMSRIDRLADDEKRALQVASVIGREFSPGLLDAVWTGATSLAEHLRELARHEFLRQRTSGDEPVYVFKHALTRDVVYGSLLERHRRHHHAEIGRALERAHAGRVEAIVEVLAHHFQLGDDDERAIDYLARAAAKAQRQWANGAALAFADAALGRLEAMPDTALNRGRRIDVVIQQAEVRFALGAHRDQVAALAAIQPLVEREPEPARRAAWHYWVGFLDSLTGGRPETAIAHCREAVAIAEQAGATDIVAYADACLAQAYHVRGDFDAGAAAGERALAVFEGRGNVWWTCRTLAQLSAIANSRGEWDRSLACCERILAHGRERDDRRLKVSALVRIASTHIQRGDAATGLAYCDEAMTVDPTPYDAAAVRAIRGYGLVKSGRVAEGVAELEAAVAWYERSNLRFTRAQFSLWLAEGFVALGDAARGRVAAEDALATCRELGYRGLARLAEGLLGRQ